MPHPILITLCLGLLHLLFAMSPALSLAVPESAYYYEGKHRSSLVPLAQIGNRAMLFRAGPDGPLRVADENFYLTYPKDWDEAARNRFEMQQGLIPSGIAPFDSIRFYRAGSAEEALNLTNRLTETTPGLRGSPIWIKQVTRRAADMGDPLLPLQWHLHNTGQSQGVAGEDLNVVEVWPQHDGHGVVLGIVDDGLELHHPDLAANISSLPQHDYVENDADPTAGSHGTTVAGVAAAVRNNGQGGSGVAPGAQLVGLRLLDETGFVDELAEAEIFRDRCLDVDIFNNSWGPPDGQSGAFTGPSPLAKAAIEEAINHGRHGLGSILVWAAGNGGRTDNSNLDGYANLRYTIAVTSTTNTGQAAVYAEPGANILVNAPSGGGSADIVTTDRSGPAGDNPGGTLSDLSDPDYTSTFSGTSASAAMVSGVVALMLEANPALNWREVQAILALSAHQNDPHHASWQTNSAGFPISTQYGFGRVDAAAAVAMASAWRDPMAPEAQSPLAISTPHLPIPDNDPVGISDSIEVAENLRIESVEVTVNIPDHTYWGDIDLRLVSPAGTEVQLATPRYLYPPVSSDIGYHMWTMSDVLHGGELSQGRWQLRVIDHEASDTGTLSSWGITVYGTAMPVAANTLPLLGQPIELATGSIPPGPVGTITAGINHHGSQFQQAILGTRQDDFLVVGGFQNTPPLAMAHALALYEAPNGSVMLYVRNDADWQEWSGDQTDLPGFSPALLTERAGMVLFQGRLAAGHYTIYLGYTSQQGALLYCPAPLQITVD